MFQCFVVENRQNLEECKKSVTNLAYARNGVEINRPIFFTSVREQISEYYHLNWYL